MSDKTDVIEHLFDLRWDVATRSVRGPQVSLQEVTNAIIAVNAAAAPGAGAPRSSRNAANFMKDFVRNVASANANWPASVLARGYTAKQVTGGSACFEFVPIPPGQNTPFIVICSPDLTVPRHRIETASLPLASRRLGRREETWLTQVIVRVRLVEAHFSLFSGLHVVQVDHLQMGVKLGKAEIDAVFLAVANLPAGHEEFIISCEAKGFRDDILEDQVIAQVKELFGKPAVHQNRVVPIAVKIIGDSQIHLVQFDEVTRAQAPTLSSLAVHTHKVYELVPPVKGVS